MLNLPLVILSIFGPKIDNNVGLSPCDILNFWPKIDKNAGITPCDFFHFFCPKLIKCWILKIKLPKIDNNAGITPCDILNFWLKIDKNAVITPCDFFSFFFGPKLIKMLDLPLVIFVLHFLAQNGSKCWIYPL